MTDTDTDTDTGDLVAETETHPSNHNPETGI